VSNPRKTYIYILKKEGGGVSAAVATSFLFFRHNNEWFGSN
jgi:hypothetical protein